MEHLKITVSVDRNIIMIQIAMHTIYAGLRSINITNI